MIASSPVHLVGSGRWARVLCRILVAELPGDCPVQMHSQHHAEVLKAWLRSEGLEGRIVVAAGAVRFDKARPGPVLIANAAANHENTALLALEARCPTLVEKPFAMSEAGARRLVTLADTAGTPLAVSNVFRFASYLERFAAKAQRLSVNAVTVDWHDAVGEMRYGERQTYDSALPLPADVLPHIVSIVDMLLPQNEITLDDLAVDRGGMLVSAKVKVGTIPCFLSLGRNQAARRRVISIRAAKGTWALDFTTEPGRISWTGGEETGDSDWSNRPGPLTQQVRSFLSGNPDLRLSPLIALRACRASDLLLPVYERAQDEWVRARRAAGADPAESGLAYAALERAARTASYRAR